MANEKVGCSGWLVVLALLVAIGFGIHAGYEAVFGHHAKPRAHHAIAATTTTLTAIPIRGSLVHVPGAYDAVLACVRYSQVLMDSLRSPHPASGVGPAARAMRIDASGAFRAEPAAWRPFARAVNDLAAFAESSDWSNASAPNTARAVLRVASECSLIRAGRIPGEAAPSTSTTSTTSAATPSTTSIPTLTSPAGNLYRAGEFCPSADLGVVDNGSDGLIRCVNDNSYDRWVHA